MNQRVSPMLEVARAWWRKQLAALDLASRITKDDARPGFTVYTIGHQMPDLDGAPNRWRITTKRQVMKSQHFNADDRAAIKRAYNRGKGRAVYALDLARGDGSNNEIVAAISYHYDDAAAHPILLLHVAMRVTTDPALQRDSHRAALILKTHLHFMKPAGGGAPGPSEVGIEVQERDIDRMGYDFDFRPAKQDVPWHRHTERVALRQVLP